MQIYDNFGPTPYAVRLGVIVSISNTYLYGVDPILIAFFGVGTTTLAMAIMGSAFSFAFGSSSKSRSKLFYQFVAASVIGATAVTAVPEIFHIGVVSENSRPVVGFFYGLFARWLMPLFIEILPTLVRRWFNVTEKS